MRPVNLIPPEARRGDHAPMRTGTLPYVLLGALAVALLAISAVVLTGKQIDDRKAEKATLEAQEAEASVRAQALAPYAEFAQVSQAREQTVTSLAQSRFDWERIMRELSLILPEDVWLTSLSGSVSPDVQLGDATASGLATGITGPSLSIAGCASGHEAVAGFLEALKDIDGVTRVGITSSERGGTDSGGSGGSSTDCKTRDFIAQFQIVVAFDDATPAVAAAPEATPAPSEPADAAQPELSAARQQEQQARDSGAEQTDKARDATNIIPGVAK